MHVQKVRNVCQALSETLKYLNTHAEFEDSRNGRVLVSPQPVCTVTYRPYERVLFSAHRDANPFFHLFEALWMLAGRRDGTFLDAYIADFSKLYAEDDGDVHGAYGFRWRHHFGFDQLDAVVRKLIEQPHDRQCVLQMWDCHEDRGNDLKGTWRDRPCNDVIFLRNNDGALDLTVCCRSNDMLWGAHGSNAVHFSVLQEYLAARIDLGIGHMYQISNNAHVYLDQYNKMISRASPEQMCDDRYTNQDVVARPMFDHADSIDMDLHKFLSADNDHVDFNNEWFLLTATPMKMAHRHVKKKDYAAALNFSNGIESPDWKAACNEWILRRIHNAERKQSPDRGTALQD